MAGHAQGHAQGHSHAEEYGAHGHKDHGHVIVSKMTLRLIFGGLLFFTLLTVGAARFEIWLGGALNVQIPTLVNVFIALSIASVKTLLVVMYFMQLKYDNPINGMIMIFTVVTVAFFLGFTALDLGNRSTLSPYKGVYISPGGTGSIGGEGLGQNAGPITRNARDAAIANGYDVHHKDKPAKASITDAGYSDKKPSKGSSPEMSRPVKRGEGDDHGHGGGGH
jgi:cytochrome c oxidase subunit IV